MKRFLFFSAYRRLLLSALILSIGNNMVFSQSVKALVYGAENSVKAASNDILVFSAEPGVFTNNGNRAEAYIGDINKAEKFEFSFRPRKYTDEKDWFVIAEWRQPPAVYNKTRGIGALYGPILISLVNGEIVVSCGSNRYEGPVNKLREQKNVSFSIFKTKLNKRGWNSVSLQIDWSDSFDGSIIINVNGVQRTVRGIRTLYDMSEHVGFKFGVYRSPRHKKQSIFDFKNVRVDGLRVEMDFSNTLKITPNDDQRIDRYLKGERLFDK